MEFSATTIRLEAGDQHQRLLESLDEALQQALIRCVLDFVNAYRLPDGVAVSFDRDLVVPGIMTVAELEALWNR